MGKKRNAPLVVGISTVQSRSIISKLGDDCLAFILQFIADSVWRWSRLRTVCRRWLQLSSTSNLLTVLNVHLPSCSHIGANSSLTILRRLELDGSFLFTFSSLSSLVHFKLLSELRLSVNVSNEDLQVIASMSNLRVLSLRACGELTDSGISALSRLHRLQDLCIEDNNLTNDSMNTIGLLSELSSLSFSSNTLIRDAGFKCLRDLPLTSLRVSDTYITDEGIFHLNISRLSYLNLSESEVSEKILKKLSPIQMRSLTLGSQGLSTLEGVRDLQRLASLTELDVYEVAEIDIAQLPYLTNLHTLSVSTCKNEDQLSCLSKLSTFIGKFPRRNWWRRIPCLTALKQRESGAVMLNDLAGLPNLQSLELCTLMSDLNMSQLGKLKSLRTLDLDRSVISDAGFTYLSRLKNLQKLTYLSRPASIEGSLAVFSSLSSLQELTIHHSGLRKLVADTLPHIRLC